jgi:restriction endonuclease S subunit
VSLCEVLCEPIHRLEAEFYTNETKNLFPMTGKDIISFVQYGTSKDLNEENKGFPILRLNEFEGQFIGTPAKYCNLIDNKIFNSLQIKRGDVLICRTNGNPNYVGKAAVAMQDYSYAFASYLFRINTDLSKIYPETLCAFLNSKTGREQINKFSMVGNQTNFSPAKFREISIPLFNKELNIIIQKIYEQSFKNKKIADTQISQAQTLLLCELNLENYKPKHQTVYTKNLSEVFEAKRMDAEYFQPKYSDIENMIKSYKGGCKKLESFVKNKTTGYPYKSELYETSGVPVIRINNIKNGEVDLENAAFISKDYANISPKDIAQQGDLVISLSGTVGNVGILRNIDKACINQRILSVTIDDFSSECMLVLLNSIVGQMQFEKIGVGGVQTNISPNDILNMLIPNIPSNIQAEIAKNIQVSNEARKQSRKLLEIAKQAVEIAIEQNEQVATDFIKGECEKLGVGVE